MTKATRKLPLTDEQLRESDLLRELFQQKKSSLKLTQEKIAAELGDGVTQGAVSHFMNRRTALNVNAASVFARLLDVPVDSFSPRLAAELKSMAAALPASEPASIPQLPIGGADTDSPLPGIGDISEDRYAFIPQYTARAAAGMGHDNMHVEVRSTLAFKREWLQFKRVKAENLMVIYAEGESMWPTISHRDVMLVDTSRVDPANGKLFVLHGEEKGLVVKRLIQVGGMWVMSSDNPDKDEYPDRYLPDGDIFEHKIRGQVIWRGGDL